MSKVTCMSLPLSKIAEGEMLGCSLAGREIVICRTGNAFYALDNICTHAHARLSEGRLRGTRLICPLHGAAFDVRDGRPLGPPAVRQLPIHEVRLFDQEIEVFVNSE
jgi:nitrite reductase/ring-hydroxylating ferredoxin subunit